MSRLTSMSRLAAWLVLSGVFLWPAAAPADDNDRIANRDQAARTEAIERALGKVAKFEFDQLPLYDVAKFIGEQYDIQVVLNRSALEAVGIATDVPVTMHVDRISLRSALNLLLRDLDLVWLIQDEVLLLTTIDEAEQIMTTKVYAVRDLALHPAGVKHEDYDSLIAAIVSTIAPTTWNQAGGPGALQAVPTTGAIVVNQTSDVHDEITTLLNSLREARAKQFQPAEGPTADKPQ